MDALQLKRLATSLREILARWGVKLSHGQVLDLVAALPGLRDWPEVVAFPDRLKSRAIDMDGMGRLSRRIAAKFEQRLPTDIASRLDGGDMLMDRLAPWIVTEPQDATRRERLIIACGHSAPGCLRRARIADRVERTAQELVWGPVPLAEDDPTKFLAARWVAWNSDVSTSDQPEPWARDATPELHDHLRPWEDHLSVLPEYARIELWMDPEPNAQLQLLQLLDWLGRQDALADKVFLMQAEQGIGEYRPFEIRNLRPRIDKVGQREFELATRAWSAFRQPTPQAWFELLSADLEALPLLRRTVRVMLGELPAAGNGLRATERKLLALVAEGGATPMSVGVVMAQSYSKRVFGYWSIGRLLDGLARIPRQAVTGLPEGPFDMALHDDAARRERYLQSSLGLSEFGEALLRDADDITRHRSTRYWWGGTKLTDERLWRWDESTSTLSR